MATKASTLKKLKTAEAHYEKHKHEREVADLRATLKEVLESRSRNASYEEFIATARERVRKSAVPEWTYKHKTGKANQSVFVAQLSDIHYEEVVAPAVVNYSNGYNPAIADKRLHNFFNNICRQAFDNLRGFEFDGLVLPLAGDFITGWIHEELQQTNALPPMAAVIQLMKPLKAGIAMLVKEFKKIHLPCVIGNHPRMTRKVAHKNPVLSSFDWFIYSLLADFFAGDDRLTFQIPESPDTFFKIYKHRFALEHGNLLKGGTNAISGIYPSVSLGNYRKKNVEQSLENPYDTLLIGDKHQLRYVGQVFINGSVIGYNEWARDMKFGFEKPQQMCFVVDPNHGPTWKGEIFVQSPDEPWMVKPDGKEKR